MFQVSPEYQNNAQGPLNNLIHSDINSRGTIASNIDIIHNNIEPISLLNFPKQYIVTTGIYFKLCLGGC